MDTLPVECGGDGKKANTVKATSAAPAGPPSPCPQKTHVEAFVCLNGIRDQKLIDAKYPWMDLEYAMDAALLQVASDVDAKRIPQQEGGARVQKILYEYQGLESQRLQKAQADAAAEQARMQDIQNQRQQQADAQAAQQAQMQAQLEAIQRAQRAAAWSAALQGFANAFRPPPSVNCTTSTMGMFTNTHCQ
jgi:hypothetical protein